MLILVVFPLKNRVFGCPATNPPKTTTARFRVAGYDFLLVQGFARFPWQNPGPKHDSLITPQGNGSSISHQTGPSRKIIIDSKVPTGNRGYVSFLGG